MTQILLVRHAEPLVDERAAPDAWPLSEAGREEARLLGARLADGFGVTTVWTSPERKALETARMAVPALEAVTRTSLSEVVRPWSPTPVAHGDAADSYLRGAEVDGWEPHDVLADRLAHMIDASTGRDGLVVVTHGLFLTCWLHQLLRLDDPASFWADLRLPDAWLVDPETRTLGRLV